MNLRIIVLAWALGMTLATAAGAAEPASKIGSRPLPVALQRAVTILPPTPAPTEQRPAPPARSWWPWVGGGLAAAAVLAGLFLLRPVAAGPRCPDCDIPTRRVDFP
jgi:hypothetical protein